MAASGERGTHWLRKNHGSSIPHNLVFLDVWPREGPDPAAADCRLQQLDFGVAHACRIEDGREARWSRCTFTTADQFWAWFAGRHRRATSLWLIGRRIASSFTLCNGWSLVDRGFYTLTKRKHDGKAAQKDEAHQLGEDDGLLVDGDPPVIFLLYAQNCTIHVVDIENYGPATVEELAASAGVQLAPQPSPGAKFLHWENFLSKRCAAVKDYFVQLCLWWKEQDYGVFRHTVGSLAMAAFRHRFMHEKILIHDCAEALELERRSLYGGEFRNYYVGEVADFWDFHQVHARKKRKNRQWVRLGPIHQYDCNSLYPYVMHQGLFPVELAFWRDPGTLQETAKILESKCAVADVLIDSDVEPWPYRHKGERYFAVGKFWACLAGPELRRAIRSGYVKTVGRVAFYHPGRPFTQFVEHFQKMRADARGAGDLRRDRFAKLLMVALGGKWGQKRSRWDFARYRDPPMRWGSWPEIDADSGELREYRAIAGNVQLHGPEGESLNSFPAIEAYINAYGRERMRQLRRLAGEANLLYQDSDGLHVMAEGAERLRPEMESYPGEPGKLRLVGVFKDAEYFGPHDYVLEGRHVLAGMATDAVQHQGGGYEQDERPTLRTLLTKQPDGTIRITKIKRNAAGYHPRGILNADGSVSPPQVLEGEIYFDRDHPDAIPQSAPDTRTPPDPP